MGAHEIQKDQGKLKKEKNEKILKKKKTEMKTIISRIGQRGTETEMGTRQASFKTVKPFVMFVVIRAI